MTYESFMTMFQDYIHTRIMVKIKECGSQSELCKQTDISAPTMSRLINGNVNITDALTLEKVSKIIGEDIRKIDIDPMYAERIELAKLERRVAELKHKLGEPDHIPTVTDCVTKENVPWIINSMNPNPNDAKEAMQIVTRKAIEFNIDFEKYIESLLAVADDMYDKGLWGSRGDYAQLIVFNIQEFCRCTNRTIQDFRVEFDQQTRKFSLKKRFRLNKEER